MGDVKAEVPVDQIIISSSSSSSSSSSDSGDESSSSSSSSCRQIAPETDCGDSRLSNSDKVTFQSEWFICQLCLYKVKTPLLLKQHMRVHTENKIYRCAICSVTFAKATRLEKHVSKHCIADDRFECAHCGKVYKFRSQIVSHMGTHKEQKAKRRVYSYSCHICPKIYGCRKRLREHVSRHENLTLHSCDVCGRSFKLNSYLVVHKRTHETKVSFMGNKPFTCSNCGKSFLSQSNLNLHMMVHSYVPESYSCDVCGKIFIRKGHYDAHFKLHQ